MSSKPNSKYSIISFCWIKFVHDVLYYRKTYVRRKTEMLPKNATFIIASNHQNSLNDAMAIILSMKRKKIWFLARADIFNGKIVKRFLTLCGILPIYRQRDGVSNLKNNFQVFEQAENFLLEGIPICLYPEAKHQNRRYLGKFYLSYTRLAFEAAALSNFSKEVFILPCANHYSNYFDIQSDLLINYGTPISLKPYYNLYQTNPRLAQEKVNEIVHAEVKSLMLDIQEVENYDNIYNLLENVGVDCAIQKNVNYKKLPDKLKTDQEIVANLEQEKKTNFSKFQQICQNSEKYQNLLKNKKIEDFCLRENYSWIEICMFLLCLFLSCPFFIFGFIHHIIPFLLPKIFSRNVKDELLKPSFLLAIGTLVTIPIFYLAYIIVFLLLSKHILLTIAYCIILPISGIFACWWLRFFRKTKLIIKTKIIKHKQSEDYANLISCRKSLKKLLFSLMKMEEKYSV